MVSAERSTSRDPGHYLWWFPGSPLKVRLSLEVVSRLGGVLHAAGPRQPVEGLLFGRTATGVTEILEFQAVDGDIRAAVAAANESGKRRLVGYYRTEHGAALRLNENDFALSRACFADPSHVFLILQSDGVGPPNGSFFFRDNEGKMPEFSLMEFPLEPALLAGEERERLKRSDEAAARRAAVLEPAAPAPTPRRRRRWILAIVAIAVALGGAGYGISVSPAARRFSQDSWARLRAAAGAAFATSPAAPAAGPPLSTLDIGLRAKRSNADVEIVWNRQSPVIRGAVSGALTITDGAAKREIALSASEIRASAVVYCPSNSQIGVQLAVTTEIGVVTESIVLLLPENGPLQVTVAPPSRTPDARPLRPFTPPSGARAQNPSEMPALPSLPARTAAPAASQDFSPILSAQPVLPPPPEPADAAAAAPPYRAAEPVRRAMPQFPLLSSTVLPKAGSVDVRVSIDETGRVTQAEAAPNPAIQKIVIDRVLAAARSWRFKPATRGDEPVASEFILHFNFSR